MIKKFHANEQRLRRHQRSRNRLKGVPSRPRLNVFRSGNHIYAQLIDDTTGRTLAAASSLDASLRSSKPASSAHPSLFERVGDALHAVTEKATEVVEAAADALPVSVPGVGSGKAVKSKGNKASSAQAAAANASKAEKKKPTEKLAPIANNSKVALAREVGKLVAQRAKEQGVTRVVFDRGGYTYHGRVASLAEGAREEGLDF